MGTFGLTINSTTSSNPIIIPVGETGPLSQGQGNGEVEPVKEIKEDATNKQDMFLVVAIIGLIISAFVLFKT